MSGRRRGEPDADGRGRGEPDADGRRRGERGSAAVELVMLTPVLALLFFAIVSVGRLTTTRSDLSGAAQLAARAASRERDASAAATAALSAGMAGLPAGPGCRAPAVAMPVFGNGQVAVTVTCTVGFDPFPGSATISETWWEPLDRVMERP